MQSAGKALAEFRDTQVAEFQQASPEFEQLLKPWREKMDHAELAEGINDVRVKLMCTMGQQKVNDERLAKAIDKYCEQSIAMKMKWVCDNVGIAVEACMKENFAQQFKTLFHHELGYCSKTLTDIAAVQALSGVTLRQVFASSFPGRSIDNVNVADQPVADLILNLFRELQDARVTIETLRVQVERIEQAQQMTIDLSEFTSFLNEPDEPVSSQTSESPH